MESILESETNKFLKEFEIKKKLSPNLGQMIRLVIINKQKKKKRTCRCCCPS